MLPKLPTIVILGMDILIRLWGVCRLHVWTIPIELLLRPHGHNTKQDQFSQRASKIKICTGWFSSFAGIDPISVADLQRIVTELKDRGLGILITDHNVRDTLSITNRSYVMYEGSIKRSGTPGELAEDSEVREIYLGESFRL